MSKGFRKVERARRRVKYPNVVKAGGVHYNLDDSCTNCGHAFECNPDGSTKMSAYPQMSTLFLRGCNSCGSIQPWKLKKGKQPWNHKINTDLVED